MTVSYGSTTASFIRVITTGQKPAPLIDTSGARPVAPAYLLLLLETCFAELTGRVAEPKLNDRYADRSSSRLNGGSWPIARGPHGAQRASVQSANLRLELPIDQDECDPASLSGAIGPAVVSTALNDDVTRAHRGLAPIEN